MLGFYCFCVCVEIGGGGVGTLLPAPLPLSYCQKENVLKVMAYHWLLSLTIYRRLHHQYLCHECSLWHLLFSIQVIDVSCSTVKLKHYAFYLCVLDYWIQVLRNNPTLIFFYAPSKVFFKKCVIGILCLHIYMRSIISPSVCSVFSAREPWKLQRCDLLIIIYTAHPQFQCNRLSVVDFKSAVWFNLLRSCWVGDSGRRWGGGKGGKGSNAEEY